MTAKYYCRLTAAAVFTASAETRRPFSDVLRLSTTIGWHRLALNYRYLLLRLLRLQVRIGLRIGLLNEPGLLVRHL